MKISGRSPRLPRSYQPGRLLRLLQGDLPGHRLERTATGATRFVPVGGGPAIEVNERVQRRFLGHIESARFVVRIPARSDGDRGLGSTNLEIRHRGRLKREGVTIDVRSGDESAHKVAEVIGGNPGFVAAAMRLDFTQFTVALEEGEWVVTVELMGASFVSLALPPMRSYIRLHVDQREALIASITALSSVVADFG